MRRFDGAAVAAAVVVTMVCAGCTRTVPPSEGPQSQQSTSLQSGTATPTIDAEATALPFALTVSPETIISTGQAVTAEPGESYEVSGRTSGIVLPSTVLSDGSAFGIEREAPDSNSGNNPVTPGIFSPDGSFEALFEIAGPLRELPGSNPGHLEFRTQNSSAFGDWVVWREGSAGGPQSVPTLESDDWRLVAWNRKTASVQEVASAYLLHGERSAPYATWDVAPTTDGQFVYFEASVPQGAQWVSSILSVPLNSPGDITQLGPGTTPFADQRDGGVFFVRDNAVIKGDKTLFAINSDEWSIGKLTGSPDLLAVTVSNGEAAWLLVWDLAEQTMLAAIDTGSDWAFPSVGARTVVWGNGSGNGNPTMYRWGPDVALVEFGSLQGLSVPITNGTEVVFPVQEGADIVWEFTTWD